MAKKMNQIATSAKKRKKPMKKTEQDERYSYTEDKHDRRADLGHDFSVKTGLKYAAKSDDENDEQKCGKDTRDRKEYKKKYMNDMKTAEKGTELYEKNLQRLERMRLAFKANKEKKLKETSEGRESLEKALNKERAKNARLQRENADLKKEMAAKAKEDPGLSHIIEELCQLARMNYHAMLESRLEVSELRDRPEISRQPARFKWLDTSKAIQELGAPQKHIALMARSCIVEKTTNKDLSPLPIEGTEATVIASPEPTESPDTFMTESLLAEGTLTATDQNENIQIYL